MKYAIGNKVRIRMPNGGFERGEIVSSSTIGNGTSYMKVEYGVKIGHKVSWYDEALVSIDPDSQVHWGYCECGGNKLKHPGHSFWCPAGDKK